MYNNIVEQKAWQHLIHLSKEKWQNRTRNFYSIESYSIGRIFLVFPAAQQENNKGEKFK